MEKWGTVRAGTRVRERIVRRPDSRTDPAMAGASLAVDPEPRGRPECARRGEPEVGGFDNDDGAGGGYDGGKPERRAAGRGPDDARAASPVAGAERRPHGPGGCGHHIMLACAARREIRGHGAALSPPEPMYSYNGDHGSSRMGARRQNDDNGGEAAQNAG